VRTIGGIFGRSAYGPLHEHALKVQDCIGLLLPLVKSFLERNWGEVTRLKQEIHQREAEADKIKNEIRRSLSHSFLHSVERTEMLLTLKSQDDVADNCEGVAWLLGIRQTPVLGEIGDATIKVCEQAASVGSVLVSVVEKLPALEERSYPPEQMRAVNALIDELRTEEHTCNILEHDALREVFRNEGSLDPVSVVFLMQIIQRLGGIADAAENTADCIERMIGRR